MTSQTDFTAVFDDDLLSSSLFLELDQVSPLSESGEGTPVSTYDLEMDRLAAPPMPYYAKYDPAAAVLVPNSPESTRPSSPASVSSGNYTSQYPSSLANSNLSEEEKERIRREKKREADRKCRKRKKERINEMESKMRRLEDERRHLISKVDMLSRARASSTEDPAAANLAQSAASLFNADITGIAAFVKSYHAPATEVVCQATVTSGKDAIVQHLLGMKQQFPNSTMKVTSVKSEAAGKFHFTWCITGMLSNGKPLDLPGHTFITVAEGQVTKTVVMWDAMRVMSQMLGMSQEELVKKAESASHFEDFIL